MCSSAQLSTTRTPIFSGEATRNLATLVLSNLGHKRSSGLRRRSSLSAFGICFSGTKPPLRQYVTEWAEYPAEDKSKEGYVRRERDDGRWEQKLDRTC